jgi:DNA primase
MRHIKAKYLDMVKSRVDICRLVLDMYPGITLKPAGQTRKKCCCVFHNEHTPSLMLNTALNRYKCFGCGKEGDVINFVQESQGLDFVGAVKYLLDVYCPDVNVNDLMEPRTPEQEESDRIAETMYIYNKMAHEFYVNRYEGDSEDAMRCRMYAEGPPHGETQGRWDKEFCRTYGLGYSPQFGNQFLKFAKEKNLNLAILARMGLIVEDEHHPGNYYDFFRGRLMIPQRDRYGRIVTFTARAINPQCTVKYLNGRESLIYKKSTSVFGIDVAMKAARQTGKVYLVEGAPDVMRLQSLGIANVVASLSGHWTKDQLSNFSSFACSLCFIPDSDVPKQGERFGAGERFVFENGRLATEMGFQVSVREIPQGDAKQDPDSYITSLDRWNALTEKDFILWYTEKHYDTEGTNDEQLKIISDVCDMLVNVQSDVLQASLLTDLKGKYRKGTVWKGALTDAARRRQELKRRQANKKSEELQGYNFYRRGNHYYDLDSQGRERPWTNFIIKPLFLIADDVKPSRIFELENDSHMRRTIELQQQDVTKLERFKEKIEGKGDFRFFERQEKYEMLKAFIYGKTEEAQRVHQMGWNNIGESGFYAFCNGIVYKGKWHAVDEYGMIRLDKENFYLPAMSKIHKHNRMAYVNERRYLHAPKQEVTARQYFTLLHELYGDNGVVCYCYYLATLFRDIITDTTRSFPILNLYGKKGTGKTELALSLVNLFQRNPEVSNLESTTYYAMGDKCSEVSNMIVHFDEYKNSLSKKHIDFLKGIYDSAGRIKRSADGERRESTNVDCGVVLSGQEIPTADIALFSRVLFLESHKSEHTKEETDKYHSFMKLRKMHPTNITIEYIRYRDNFNAGWYNAWKRALKEIKSDVDYSVIGERFINNWAMMLATYYCLSQCVDSLPFNEKMVHDICIDRLKYQHSLCNSTDEIAIFWAMFSKSRQLGDIREGQDYKIKAVDKLAVTVKGESHKVIQFDKPRQILFVRSNICVAKANIQAKKEGKVMIPDESLLSYLMATPEYFGKTRSPLKFRVLDESGMPKRSTNDKGESVLVFDQERVLAFDYDAVCACNDINLHAITERIDPLKTNSVIPYDNGDDDLSA